MNGEYFDLYKQNNIENKQTYLENIINNNIGKKINVHIVIPGNNEFNNLEGILENATSEYLIISNPSNGSWHMILFIYIAYITFLEHINLN